MNLFLNYGLLDIHFARFLAARSGLVGEELQEFETAVCDLSAALAAGHSCLPVGTRRRQCLVKTRLVSSGDPAPLVLSDNRLYLHRYFSYEAGLAARIRRLAERRSSVPAEAALLDACFGPDPDGADLQRAAAQTALRRDLILLCGGPGTGKTSTVVRIIGILLQAFGADLQVALAAPTGKAAMRLRQSVGASLDRLPFSEQVKAAIPVAAQTLHRLLGVRGDSPRFRHHSDNPLPWDVVVVDEASMVDLAMMSKLVEALKPGARLVLLGDKDQLASVESGAVLSDLVHALPENTVELQRTYRFDATIRELALAVNRGDGEAAWRLLADQSADQVALLKAPLEEYAGGRYLEYRQCVAAATDDDGYRRVFAVFNRFRILCAVRRGRQGVEGVNAAVERYLTRAGYDCFAAPWYPGRPVLITRNDYSLDLYNGDIGICLPDPESGVLQVWFERPDGTLKSCMPYRLPQCETAYALTIHKCQGSEFAEVLVVLPEEDNRVLGRELVYTAVTRAGQRVVLAGERERLLQTLARKMERFSGLKEMLAGQR